MNHPSSNDDRLKLIRFKLKTGFRSYSVASALSQHVSLLKKRPQPVLHCLNLLFTQLREIFLVTL